MVIVILSDWVLKYLPCHQATQYTILKHKLLDYANSFVFNVLVYIMLPKMEKANLSNFIVSAQSSGNNSQYQPLIWQVDCQQKYNSTLVPKISP